MMRAKKIWILSGTVLLVGVVCVAALGGEKGRPVQAEIVARGDIHAKVSASGKVQAVHKVDISANVMGQVMRLAVKEGDLVKAGDFLLEIDPVRSRFATQSLEARLQATALDLETANAKLAQVKNDYQRAERNRTAGIIAQSDFEQVKTAMVTAQNAQMAVQRRVDEVRADLAGARDTLKKSTITAPMDGVVTARQIERGETAVIGVQNSPGTVLLTISDMSNVEAEMEVDEASIPKVRLGQEAQVRIDAYPNEVFEGVVTEVGGSPSMKAAQSTATKFKVKVRIKTPPPSIKPGLSAQADIFTGKRDQVLSIPLQALVVKEGKPEDSEKRASGLPARQEGVYVAEGGKAKFVPIKTGLMGALVIEVIEGLKGGETIITGPFRALREFKTGDPVTLDMGKRGEKR